MESDHTITAEIVDFRTLAVFYEEQTRKLSIIFDHVGEGHWLAREGLKHWHTGVLITEPERQQVVTRLNAWGKTQGWNFDLGIPVLDIHLEDVPPEQRAFVQMMQDVAREHAERMKKILGE